MKDIIFLDIDNVLNTLSWTEENNWPISNDRIDCSKIKILNRIIKECNHEIDFVLSSDWRITFNSKQIQSHLSKFGFEGNFIGHTDINDKSRFQQISDWIDNNTDIQIDNFVIIDDIDVCIGINNKLVLKHFFRVDPEIGLTDEIANRIIKFLNNEL